MSKQVLAEIYSKLIYDRGSTYFLVTIKRGNFIVGRSILAMSVNEAVEE